MKDTSYYMAEDLVTPVKPKKPKLPSNPTGVQAMEFANLLVKYESDMDSYSQRMSDYNKERARRKSEFIDDLLVDEGIVEFSPDR